MSGISPYKIIRMFPTPSLWNEFLRDHVGISPYQLSIIRQNHSQDFEEQRIQVIEYWQTINRESTCSKLLEKANRFFEQKKEQDQNNSTVSNRPSQPATPTVQASSSGKSYMQYRLFLSDISNQLTQEQFSKIHTLYSYKFDNRRFDNAHDLLFAIEDKNAWDPEANTIDEKLDVLKDLFANTGCNDFVRAVEQFGGISNPIPISTEPSQSDRPSRVGEEETIVTTPAETMIFQHQHARQNFDGAEELPPEDVDTKQETLPPKRSTSRIKENEPKIFGDDTICESVAVQQCTDMQQYSLHLNDPSVYPIQNNPKGHVLIINNNFSGDSLRSMAKRDVELMENLWTGMQCEVEVKEDLSAKDMYKELNEFTRATKHIYCDLAVVFLMSHGCQDYVIGNDFKNLEIRKIEELFNNKNAITLRRKPKLLFFQCCRGDNGDKGVPYVDIVDKPSRSDISGANDTLCTESDLLVVHSTVKGNVSFRNCVHGSWLINAIANIFQREAKKLHVDEMVTEVRKAVSERTSSTPQNETSDNCKQMSTSTTTLCKRLYLFPGLPKKTTDV